MKNIAIYNLLKYAAIAGNLIWVLCILRTGINEGFHRTRVEVVSYTGLLVLPRLNAVLLYRKEKTS